MLNKGFTLVEILVAILIIAVLAAIALPRYHIAVGKSKAVELLANVRSAREAILLHKLATGVYPSSWEQLDISLPFASSTDDGGANTNAGGSITTYNGNTYWIDVDGYVAGSNKDINITAFFTPAQSGTFKGNMVCRAPVTNETSNQICLAVGGTLNGVQSGTYNVYAVN